MSDEVKTTTGASDTAESSESTKKQDRKEYFAKYYAENKEEIAIRRKATRLERNAADRERYATNPAAREQRLKIKAKGRQTQRERIATDPIAKKQHEERLAKRRERHKERLATDPEYRRQREEFTDALREKRRNEKKGEDKP